MQKAQIDLYSHFFKVSKIHPSLYPVIRKASEELLQVRFVKIRGRFKKESVKVYAAKNPLLGERRFHINYYSRFKELLASMRINDSEITVIPHALYEAQDFSAKMPESVVMRDYQLDVIDYIEKDGCSKLVTLPTGTGKGLPPSTLVRVPNGWCEIGRLKKGDVVLAYNGDRTNVIGVYDNDDMEMVRVTFEDGRWVDCDTSHLWGAYIEESNSLRTLSSEHLERLFRGNPSKYAFHFSVPIADLSQADRMSLKGYDDLRKYGESIADVVIDEEYMTVSHDDTIALLNGLLDLYQNKTSLSYIIHSLRSNNVNVMNIEVPERHRKNTKLLKQIIDMLRRVGLKPVLVSSDTISISRGIQGFDRLAIKSVKSLMTRMKTRCIKIAHESSLFVIKDYIVTHNTFTSLKASEQLGKRLLVMVLGRYKEKWVEDVVGAYGNTVKIVVVKGLAHLIQLIQSAKEGEEIGDVIIVTTTVMQNYISEWEAHAGQQIDGMVPPEEIYETLGIGVRIIDEAHQHFHAVFKNDLYTHCPKCIYLTATLESNEKFMRTMYETMWPAKIRTQSLKAPMYDNTIALYYQHMNPDRIRCTGQQGYSHMVYEQSIWRHIPSRCQYLDMIGDVVETYFLPIYEPGKKMLIFCSLVDTCNYVASYLSKRFKEKKWQISKFVAGDPKSVIDTNDITVSTLGKSGTALDIDGLVVCYMAVALAEPKANIQAKGRLRDLSKKPGFEHIVPKFLYSVGIDIDRHQIYHREKKELFKSRTLSHVEQSTGYIIGQPMHEYLQGYGRKARWDAWGVKEKGKGGKF